MAKPTRKSRTIAAESTSNQKLLQLPKGTRVQKRPILRPAIPSPYSSSKSRKVVYVSYRTPFISAVKRIRSLLKEVENRGMGKIEMIDAKGSDGERIRNLKRQIDTALKEDSKEDGLSRGSAVPSKEAVYVVASSRAIDKALKLGLYLIRQDDLAVQFKTSSVGVIDDIFPSAKQTEHKGPKQQDQKEQGPLEKRDHKSSEESSKQPKSETKHKLPESRIRHMSSIEIAVTNR